MGCADSCSSIDELVIRAAQQLGDYNQDAQFVTWTRASLYDYMNEALCQLAANRPDAFAEVVDLALRPGSLQTLPDEYVAFVAIEENATPGAEAVSTVSAQDAYYAKVLRNKRCKVSDCVGASGAYVVETATKSTTSERLFTVSPPVPFGASPTVKATVVTKPPKYCPTKGSDCSGVPCKYEAALVEWTLFRAWSQDAELAGSVQKAQMHYKNFFQMLGVQLKREAAYGSGYWQGQRGNGDENFRNKL